MLLALLAGFIAAAQDCPWERIELLDNKTLKVLPLSEDLQRLGYKGFYSDIDLKEVFKRIGKTSDYNALAGKEFKVVSFERYANRAAENRYKLLLKSPEGDALYYDYNPADCSAFPFEIKRAPKPPVDYCADIKTDKTSSGVPYYGTRYTEGVTLGRYFAAEKTYTVIEVKTNSVPAAEQGVSIQLSNNVTIERADSPVVAIKNGLGLNTYMAVVVLKEEEAELVKNNEIVKTTMGGNIVTEVKKGPLLKAYFNCLINREPLEAPAPKFKASCDLITTDLTAVPGEQHYLTPRVNGLTLKKIVDKKGVTFYFGVVNVLSDTMHIGKGVMIVFDDDALLSYPDSKVTETTASDGSYIYTVAFPIKIEDMRNFVSQHVRGIKVIDIVTPIDMGDEIQIIAQCLVNK